MTFSHTLLLVINDENLRNIYKERIKNHNIMVIENPCPDSGFDLLFPDDVEFDSLHTNDRAKLVDLQVKAVMMDNQRDKCIAYQLYPRSSIAKHPLVLANHVGVIDSGYRGNLMTAFRTTTHNVFRYKVEKHTRLVQICLPSLQPFEVRIVDENELSDTTRGSGGFGSTGV
jgi:deoxyuridine 5'-triphosphate nucleotidohydrolase